MKRVILSLITTLALGDSIDEGLTRLNSIRTSVGLNEFNINTILQTSAYNHSLYLISNNAVGHGENSLNVNFTGISPQDRMVEVGYNNYSTSENIAFGSESYVGAVDSLMTAIYHRFGFLDFSMDEIGFEKYEDENYYYKSVYTFNMGNSNIVNVCNSSYDFEYGEYYTPCVNKDLIVPKENYEEALHNLKIVNSKIVTYPYDGQIDFTPVFDDTESPDPTPNMVVSGNPISIQFNDYYVNEVNLKNFKLYDMGDVEIESEIVTSKNDVNAKLTPYQFVLFPKKRLNWNSYYRVKASFDADGEEILKEFTFKTKALNYPELSVSENGQILNIEANKGYAVSIDSNLIEKIESFSSQFYGKCDIEIFDVNTLTLSADKKCVISIGNINFALNIVADDELVDINDSQIILAPENKITLQLLKGWNLVALPIDVKSYEPSNLGEYNSLWTYISGKWNENPSMLNSGIGFWINSSETREVEFSGDGYSPNLTILDNGWNLLGTGNKLNNLSGVSRNIWKYNQIEGWVSNPTIIEGGEGFWLKK